jgi:hypothetical protein
MDQPVPRGADQDIPRHRDVQVLAHPCTVACRRGRALNALLQDALIPLRPDVLELRLGGRVFCASTPNGRRVGSYTRIGGDQVTGSS